MIGLINEVLMRRYLWIALVYATALVTCLTPLIAAINKSIARAWRALDLRRQIGREYTRWYRYILREGVSLS